MDARDVTGIILAGGKSRRMGRDKLFIEVDGRPLFERVFTPLHGLFDALLIVANEPARFADYPAPVCSDLYSGSALGGLFTGLYRAATPWTFVCAADMPFVNTPLIHHLIAQARDVDIVVPVSEKGLEPLFACYSKQCLAAFEQALRRNQHKIIDAWEPLRVREVPIASLPAIAGLETAFINLNQEEDVQRCQQLCAAKRVG